MTLSASLPPIDEPLSQGQRLRHDAAVEAGVTADTAEGALRRLASLEAAEYLKRQSGLSSDARRTLWSLRAGLRALDVDAAWTALSEEREVGRSLQAYWTWVIAAAYPTVPAGAKRPINRIPGNLASAIAQEPDRREFVLAAWRNFAELLGIDHEATLARLGSDLDRCRPSDVEAPTLRTLRLGNSIAVLSGMPPQLIAAHSDAWLREHAILMATNEALNDRARNSSMEDYRRGVQAEVSLDRAPHTKLNPDGQCRLVLAAPELAMLNDEIAGRVIMRLLLALRKGELPRSGVSFAVAHTFYRDRMNRRRGPETLEDIAELGHVAGLYEEKEPADPTSETEEPALEVAQQFTIAQDWLSGSIDASMRRLAASLRECGPDGVFPTAPYGRRKSAGLGSIHLRAAQNCLQYVTSAAHLDRTRLLPKLPSESRPKAEFARHMRSTAPVVWSDSTAARQAIAGFTGAVASAAWLAATDIDPADAPSIAADAARELVVSLQNFVGLGALHGMAGMLRRYAPANGRPRPAWCDTVRAGSVVIEELATALARRPGIAVHPGLAEVRDAIRTLADEYAAVLGQADLTELAIAVKRLRRAVDVLTFGRAA